MHCWHLTILKVPLPQLPYVEVLPYTLKGATFHPGEMPFSKLSAKHPDIKADFRTGSSNLCWSQSLFISRVEKWPTARWNAPKCDGRRMALDLSRHRHQTARRFCSRLKIHFVTSNYNSCIFWNPGLWFKVFPPSISTTSSSRQLFGLSSALHPAWTPASSPSVRSIGPGG